MKNNLNVAIIGKPNVGKSSLFNRLIQKKISITYDEPGTTRDRIIHRCSWLDTEFNIIDTGGYLKNIKIDFQEQINKQVEMAIDVADVVLFITSNDDLTIEDKQISSLLLRNKVKNIIFCVNKCDNLEKTFISNDYYKMGLDNPIPISSIHGIGIADLLDKIISFSIKDNFKNDNNHSDRIGVVGKPNVGKSTFINSILKKERLIVSNTPGTTRDSIDTRIKWNKNEFIITDTAGIKKKKKNLSDIEWYSELRSNLTINNSDYILLMIDPKQKITKIDERIMSRINEVKKPFVILINKKDLLSSDERERIKKELRTSFKFVPYLEFLFISSLNSFDIYKPFKKIMDIKERIKIEINKSQLNDFLNDIQMIKKPPRNNGIEVKLKYISYSSNPKPTFVIFSNHPDKIHFSYKRFIENQIRNLFNFKGIPLIFKYKR